MLGRLTGDQQQSTGGRPKESELFWRTRGLGQEISLKRYLLLAQKESLPALDLLSQGVSSQLPYVLGNAWSLTGSPQHLLPAVLLRSAEKHTLPPPPLSLAFLRRI